jgi:hypothetical protein
MGICPSDRIGAPSKMQYPDIKTKHLEKRRGITFINKLRARKEKKVQATRGLRGKSPCRQFMAENLLCSLR